MGKPELIRRLLGRNHQAVRQRVGPESIGPVGAAKEAGFDQIADRFEAAFGYRF